MSETLELKKTLNLGTFSSANTFDRKTEILDVAPIDLINGASKQFISSLPGDFLSPELKAQAIDFEYHWVNEDGKTPSF